MIMYGMASRGFQAFLRQTCGPEDLIERDGYLFMDIRSLLYRTVERSPVFLEFVESEAWESSEE